MIRVVNPSHRFRRNAAGDNPEAMKKVIAARVLLISPAEQKQKTAKRTPGRPYLGTAAMALILVESHHPALKTAAVDSSWRMYFNADFVMASDIEAVATVMEHEIWHLLRRHGRRAEKLGVPRVMHDIWNIAADCETHNDNGIYERIKNGTPITPYKAEDIGAVSGMLAEDYYRFLMEKAETEEHQDYTKITIDPSKNEGDDEDGEDGEDGDGDGGDGGPGGDGDGDGDGDGGGGGRIGSGSGGDRGGGRGGEIVIYVPKGDGQGGDGDGEGPPGEGPPGDGPTTYTPGGSSATNMPCPWELPPTDEYVSRSRADNIVQETAKKIARGSLGRGTGPSGEAMAWADTELNPRVDWRAELDSQISDAAAYAAGNTDFYWGRMSRRQDASPDFRLPGTVHPELEIAVVIDVSGSMYSLFHSGPSEAHNKAVANGNLLEQAIAEVKEIVEQFGSNAGVQLFATDTAVVWAERVFSADQIPVPVVGGGTDIAVGMNAAYFADPQPNVMIVLTDGATPWRNDQGEMIECPPGVEVVLGIIGSTQEQLYAAGWEVPTWARVVYIN